MIKPGFCQCGCGEETKIVKRSIRSEGYRRGQYRKFIVGHAPRSSPLTYRIDGSGCWIWQRQIRPDGYGFCRAKNGKQGLAHRVYYEDKFGPIKNWLQLDHLCRIRACVNPSHMEQVTNAENSRRSSKSKLNKEKIREIRTLCNFVSFISIAEHYAVHPSTISAVHRSVCWGDVK